MTRLVAVVAVRTGIAPQALAECDPAMFDAILGVLREQDRQSEQSSRRR
jgi:hypothetical protein